MSSRNAKACALFQIQRFPVRNHQSGQPVALVFIVTTLYEQSLHPEFSYSNSDIWIREDAAWAWPQSSLEQTLSHTCTQTEELKSKHLKKRQVAFHTRTILIFTRCLELLESRLQPRVSHIMLEFFAFNAFSMSRKKLV